MVIRHIRTDIPSPDLLGLPRVLKETIMEKRGLILFVRGYRIREIDFARSAY